jgi:hypothetical protein
MAFIDGDNGENFITERLIEQWDWLEQLPKQAPWINDVLSGVQNDGLPAIRDAIQQQVKEN